MVNFYRRSPEESNNGYYQYRPPESNGMIQSRADSTVFVMNSEKMSQQQHWMAY